MAGPVREAVSGDPGPLVTALRARIDALAAAGRYEDAATVRGRLAALLRACMRRQRQAGIAGIAELSAARPAGGGWELAVVRRGRLASAGYARPGEHPRPVLDAVLATAETVLSAGPEPAATAEETARILDWLELPDTRLVSISAEWASPLRAAARFTRLLDTLDAAATRPPP